MGNSILPLNKMTIKEKIQIMEELWNDLSKKAEDVPLPEWHNQILREREENYKRGIEKSVEWEKAKKQIRNNLQ